MAEWITHMIIADNLLNKGLTADKIGFCVGNIAPDCNVENEDWTVFTPPKHVTHWMNGDSKYTVDYEGFYDQYIRNKDFELNEEYSFYLGYFSHLITDVEFQKFVRDEQRIKDSFVRIKSDAEMAEKIVGLSEDFDTIKSVFGGRKDVFRDIAIQEWNYLKEHPDSGYNTVLREIRSFPDYLDYLPEGAIMRKIGVMAVEAPTEIPECKYVFFSKAEFERFVRETSDKIYERVTWK